jgi:hypothetical protein
VEGGGLNLQGSSAVINGGIEGGFATGIQIDNSSLIAGSISVSQQGGGAFINNSTVTVNEIFVSATADLSVVGGALTVLGDVANVGGSVSMSGTVKGTISNGGFQPAESRLSFDGSAHSVQNSGSMEAGSLVVTGGGFNNNSGGSLTLSGVANIMGGFTNSGGSVIVSPNALLTTDKYSQSDGSIDVSGSLSTASYKQSGGTTTIENGGLIKAGSFQATGGAVTVKGILDPTAVEIGPSAALRGTGTIIGNVAMGGTITPGPSGVPGTLTIFGNYEQIGTGTLDELMSPFSQAFLHVTGDVALDSDSLLQITLLNGFNPLGRTFSIMDYSSLVGEFSNGSSFLDDGYLWDITYRQHGIDVTAVGTPEPSSFLLLGLGLLVLAGYAARKLAGSARTNILVS